MREQTESRKTLRLFFQTRELMKDVTPPTTGGFRLNFGFLAAHYFKAAPKPRLQAFPFFAFSPSAWFSCFQTLWLSSQFVPSLWSRARCCLQPPPPFHTFPFLPYFYPRSFLMSPTLVQSRAPSPEEPVHLSPPSVLPQSSPSLPLFKSLHSSDVSPPHQEAPRIFPPGICMGYRAPSLRPCNVPAGNARVESAVTPAHTEHS